MDRSRLASGRLAAAAWIALIVATLVLLPTLVRATQSLNRDFTTIRLTRGFDAPKAKCRVEPPSASVSTPATPVVLVEFAPDAALFAWPADSAPLLYQHDVSPPVLRGPPASRSNS